MRLEWGSAAKLTSQDRIKPLISPRLDLQTVLGERPVETQTDAGDRLPASVRLRLPTVAFYQVGKVSRSSVHFSYRPSWRNTFAGDLAFPGAIA